MSVAISSGLEALRIANAEGLVIEVVGPGPSPTPPIRTFAKVPSERLLVNAGELLKHIQRYPDSDEVVVLIQEPAPLDLGVFRDLIEQVKGHGRRLRIEAEVGE
jgi:hypothetical protein